MRVAFRVDVSSAIGAGHVMRCLALAAELRRAGARCTFLSATLPEPWARRIVEAGHRAQRLDAPEAGSDGDAAATRAALREGPRPDWVVVDHYAIGLRWEEAVRAQAGALLVIDDLANRRHRCDVLLDQNLVADPGRRDAARLTGDTLRLFGPEVALLRDDFARTRARLRPRRGQAERLLVSLGASDPDNATATVLDALRTPAGRGLRTDVVVGELSPHRERLARACGALPNVTLHAPARDIAALMAGADIAVGAGGITQLERCCLGLPGILVTVAENQVPGANFAARAGLARHVGAAAEATAETLAEALGALRTQPDPLRRMSDLGMLCVDGEGAARVAALMDAPGASGRGVAGDDPRTGLRPAVPEDAERLFEWRNDPGTREASVHTAPIELAEHLRWLEDSLRDPARRLLIVERHGEPVGTVRADLTGAGYRLSWTIAPAHRGHGLARASVARVVRRLRGPVHCEIKPGNAASIRVAEAAGLRFEGESQGVLHYARDAH